MTQDLSAFRQEVLAALARVRQSLPDSLTYLLYAPGFDDPLRLSTAHGPHGRLETLIFGAGGTGYAEQQYPRIVQLDCRRVARFLLETDPVLDDPLLEASIAHAHQRLHESRSAAADGEVAARAVCGWLVSPDSGETIARRFSNASQRVDPASNRKHWLRWHDPRMATLLWHTLADAQKTR